MNKKKMSAMFASLIKKVAVASVGETSDWYSYQVEEPDALKQLYEQRKRNEQG